MKAALAAFDRGAAFDREPKNALSAARRLRAS